MFDFGDELTIGSQRIPWLIWIQILVMLLLIILLYHFAIIALGLDPSPDASAASPSAALLSGSSRHRQLSNAAAAAAANTSRLHSAKVGENHSIKDDATSSTRKRGVKGEDIQEREGICYHPCHYFGLAKQAFLKCLGFDPAYKDSPNTNQRKEE